jgi:hypothetical protein
MLKNSSDEDDDDDGSVNTLPNTWRRSSSSPTHSVKSAKVSRAKRTRKNEGEEGEDEPTVRRRSAETKHSKRASSVASSVASSAASSVGSRRSPPYLTSKSMREKRTKHTKKQSSSSGRGGGGGKKAPRRGNRIEEERFDGSSSDDVSEKDSQNDSFISCDSDGSRLTRDHALPSKLDLDAALGLDDDEDEDDDDSDDQLRKERRRVRSAEKTRKKTAHPSRLRNFLDDDASVDDSRSVASQFARARDATGGGSDEEHNVAVERVPPPPSSQENLGGIEAVDKDEVVEEKAWAERIDMPREPQPVIRYHTPTCEGILNEFNPSAKRFDSAFLEMQQKWVGCFNRTQQDWISQLMINFNLSWNAEKFRLKFKTNKAEQPHPNDRFRRSKKKKKRNGHGGDNTDTDESKDSDDVDDDDEEEGTGKCVYGNEAIQHAFETEVHLAFFLWAYCNVEASVLVGECVGWRVRWLASALVGECVGWLVCWLASVLVG